MTHRPPLPGFCLFAALAVAAPVSAAELAAPRALVVYPTAITLDGPRAEQRVGVLGDYPDGRRLDLSRDAQFLSSAPKVAAVDASGVLRAAGDGEATLTVRAGGLSATLPVKVRRAAAEVPVSFVREVAPLLTKAGCNQGACHGAAAGRGGFKLSLLGYDPAFDHKEIVESAEGRRVVLSDPERSILLQKPALLMEHGGGERLPAGSRGHELLRRWLEDGAPAPEAKPPTATALEVWPPQRAMAPGESQQLIVRAAWDGGPAEDVTATAQFDSLNDGVAAVTPGGLVSAKAAGETYGGQQLRR